MKPPRLLPDSPATSLFPLGEPTEPFGEISYPELVEHYAVQALAKKKAGAQHLTLRAMPGLAEARAAVLGARAAELPLYVSVSTVTEAGAAEPEELLAALICLQELGVAAFGLDFEHAGREAVDFFIHLAPYAKVPLLARPQSPTGVAAFAALLRAGATLLACDERDPVRTEQAARAVAEAIPAVRPPRAEDAPLLLCDGSGVYYLEEDFTLSDEIGCALDMAEEILALEDRADALCFRVETVDDAHFLGLNAHMARSAACIRAAGPEALDMALLLYNGRALVDARSELEETDLETIARMYGAIVR